MRHFTPLHLCHGMHSQGHPFALLSPFHHHHPHADILDNPTILHCCPIAHLIPRDPSATAYSDLSFHAAGEYLDSLQFWWHIQWPQDITACAAKAKTNNTIGINALKYAALILNYVAATAAYLQQPHKQDPFPSLLLFTDNVASRAWIIKGAKNLPEGKALGCLQDC